MLLRLFLYIYWGTVIYNGLHVAVIGKRSYPQFMLSLVEGQQRPLYNNGFKNNCKKRVLLLMQ